LSFFKKNRSDSIDDLDQLRELLISSLHSNSEAQSYFNARLDCLSTLHKLCTICAPYDRYSNDPRMAAAHYISKYPDHLLVQVMPILLVIVNIPSNDYEDMNSNIIEPLLKAIDSARSLYRSTIYQDFNSIKEHYGLSQNA